MKKIFRYNTINLLNYTYEKRGIILGLFKKKKEEEINNSSTITRQNVEKYLNEIEDIICLTDYDGNIEKINNPDIHTQYTSLKEILFEVENKDIYNEIMDKIQSENTFVKDIEVLKHKDKVNYYIIAFNLKEIKKIIFYIRTTYAIRLLMSFSIFH